MRLVIDTNVFISAYGFGGKPLRLLEAAVMREFDLVTSPPLLLELAGRLHDVLGLSGREVETALKQIARIAVIVRPEHLLSVIADESDNRVLECALEGEANLIVSGDRHILSLEAFEDIEIVRPAEALVLLGLDL